MVDSSFSIGEVRGSTPLASRILFTIYACIQCIFLLDFVKIDVRDIYIYDTLMCNQYVFRLVRLQPKGNSQTTTTSTNRQQQTTEN